MRCGRPVESVGPALPDRPRFPPGSAASYLDRTKIVTAGDAEFRATRNETGIDVECDVTNSTAGDLPDDPKASIDSLDHY